MAMKYHPDRVPEEKKKEYEEKFKEINEAASILGDEKKRQQYDQFGSAAFQGGSGGGGYQNYDYSDVMSQFRSGMFGDFDDIFDQLFGGSGKRHPRGQRGSDLLYEVTITLNDVATGTTKAITLNKLENCSSCQGRGATKFENCHHCHGSGYIKKTQRTPFGLFQQTGPCPNCNGRGEAAQDTCSTCDGEGAKRRKKEIEVTIPAGVEDNMRLRVTGEGEIGQNGGSPGDLYILIHVKEHEHFVREGDDIHLRVPISFTQAALGDEIEVPTITGKALLTIPAGTASETTFRMKGKGLPSVHGHNTGDEMVTVRIEVPKKLTKKQMELIKQLNEEKPSKSFFKKIFG